MSNFNNILQPTTKTPLIVMAGGTIIILLISTVYFIIAQPVLPIFYTLPNPVNQLVHKGWIAIFPTLSILFSFIHGGVIPILKNQDEVLIRIFVWTGVVFQFLLFVALMRIILITI